MAKITIDSGRTVFANLKHLYFTPWVNDKPGTTSYDLVNIVGDTTSSEQDDNEINEIAHEFSNAPLYENVNLGKKNFATECLDFQNDVIEHLFGWKKDTNGAYAPTAYTDLYCTIEMGFNSTNDVIVLPKVKLNSKAVIASLKTDASRANIAGTCYNAYVKIGAGNTEETDMFLVRNTEATPKTYSIGSKSNDLQELDYTEGE